jgi:hypothetical protein
MRYDEVREMLLRQWKYTGGPNEAIASAIYHDDAVLEFPQSGERFRGKANIQGWRERYPARLEFEPREIRGAGDLWVAEAGSATTMATPSTSSRSSSSAASWCGGRRSTSPTRSRLPTGASRGRTTARSRLVATSRPSSTAAADRRPRRRSRGRPRPGGREVDRAVR